MSPEAWAILALVAYAGAAAALVVHDARRCRDGRGVWFLHVVARFYTPLVFRQRIEPACPLPARGGGLIVANHRCPVDPILIFSGSPLKREGYAVRRLEFLTASEYFEVRGFPGYVLRTMQSIPVDRDGRDTATVKSALRRLRQGRLVGVFPEGRINPEEGLLPFNPGVAWLALHSQTPVFPVFLIGSPRGRNMVEPFHTFSRVEVRYGEPVDLSPYYGRRITQDLLAEVTDLLRRRLAGLGGVQPEAVPRHAREAPASLPLPARTA